MKESWRFQQCDTPEQTLWQLLLPCRRLARARRELGWARSGCELWHWCSCRDKLWRLWLPDSSNHPKSQLFPLFCCRFRDPKAVQWWALSSEEVATALPLKGSISYKWWIWNCLLKKLGAMLEMIKGPLDSSGLGEPFEASTLLRPRWQIHAWYSPGEVNVPELPWPCWECSKKGVTSLVLWIVIVGSLIMALQKLIRILSEAEQFQSNFPHCWRQQVVPILALFGRRIKVLCLGLSTDRDRADLALWQPKEVSMGMFWYRCWLPILQVRGVWNLLVC